MLNLKYVMLTDEKETAEAYQLCEVPARELSEICEFSATLSPNPAGFPIARTELQNFWDPT